MKPEALPVETRIMVGKSFPSDTGPLLFGPYRLVIISGGEAQGSELLLGFDTIPVEGHSHPEEEATLVSQFLALLLNTKAQRRGLRINGIDIPDFDPERRSVYRDFYGAADKTNLLNLGPRLFSVPDQLARQYLRAARAYATALDAISEDQTFTFLLLVVAVECLSSQDGVIPHAELPPDGQTCERFCEFIRRFLPETVRSDDERNDGLLTELLKTAYYAHRSAFVHGGKEVSGAASLADRVGSSYVKHSTDGPEVKTPGVAWFARVVRYSLLGFLAALPIRPPDHTLLARIAAERVRLRLRSKHDVTAGDVVSVEDDIDYR